MSMHRNRGMWWADKTWAVMSGCTKISPGCKNCMAEQSIGRWRMWNDCWSPGAFNGEKAFTPRLQMEHLFDPQRTRSPWRILVAPHGDLFHERVYFEYFLRIMIIMELTPHHTYFLLTKRPERMKEYLERCAEQDLWPLPNVNIGASAENQEWLEKRAPILNSIPVHDLAYRYLSCEPLLGPIELGLHAHSIGWLIYGPERGTHRRPMKEEWGHELRNECGALSIPVYRHRSPISEEQQIVQQRRQQKEDEMKIELLQDVPKDSTPSLVLDRRLMDNVRGVMINGVAIVFTQPGEMGDDPVAVPINSPAKAMHKSPFDQKSCVSEPKQVKTGKDVAKLQKNYDTLTAFAEDIGVTITTLHSVMDGREITERTRVKVEKYLRRHYKGCTFEATIRSYPGGR